MIVGMTDLPRQPDDEQRFAEWVNTHGRAVRGYLGAVLGRADLADDLTQEVFCRAWQARDRYREQGSARAYLLRIADRLACDHARSAKPCVQLDDDGWRRHEPAATGSHVNNEDKELLQAALERLTDVQRRVVLLRYYGQCSFAEIAQMIGCPLNSALSHCHRGLASLRKLLVVQS